MLTDAQYETITLRNCHSSQFQLWLAIRLREFIHRHRTYLVLDNLVVLEQTLRSAALGKLVEGALAMQDHN